MSKNLMDYYAAIARTTKERRILQEMADGARAAAAEREQMPEWAKAVASVGTEIPVSVKVEHEGLTVETWTSKSGKHMSKVFWADGTHTIYDSDLSTCWELWDRGCRSKAVQKYVSTKPVRHYYAEFAPYGIMTKSDGDRLMRFESREERDAMVERINAAHAPYQVAAEAVTVREAAKRYNLKDFDDGDLCHEISRHEMVTCWNRTFCEIAPRR